MTRRAGYSLFEVLVAFAVMSLVLATLLPGQSAVMTRAATGSERVIAQDYALSLLALADLRDLPQPGRDTQSYRNWQVVRDVTRVPGIDATDWIDISIEITDQSGRVLASAQARRADTP